MEKEKYNVESALSKKNIKPFLLGLFGLLLSLYFTINRSLLFSILFLTIGIVLEVIWFRLILKGSKGAIQFVEETSTFIHNCSQWITVSDIVNTLKSKGFSVKEYPYGNYYCFLLLDKKHPYHFFVANNDTPDCREAEEFSALFISKIAETGSSNGNQYFVDFEYGNELDKKTPEFIEVLRKGFMITKDGMPFGFRVAYDTKTNILYYAEAVTSVVWQKGALLSTYTNKLFNQLYTFM